VKRTRGADGGTTRHTTFHPRKDALRLSMLGVCLHAHTHHDERRDEADAYLDACMLQCGIQMKDKDYLMREIFLSDYNATIPTLTELKRRTACKVGLAGAKNPAPPAATADRIALDGWATFDAARVVADVDGVLACLHIPAA
jgi:hypothetical protein